MHASSFPHKLVREPLVHFMLIGAVLFGVDHLTAARRDNPRVIEVTSEIDQDARAIFKAAMNREPSAKEMQILRARWIDNEVLYREGLALGVDQGDKSIRDRVIFKALSVMQANIALPKIDPKGLQAWFEQHRARYDEPARFDFLEAVVVGAAAPDSVRKLSVALNSGIQDERQASLRVFKARPRDNLVTSYGTEFTEALEKMTVGQWQALPSREGARVVRLEARTEGVAASYNDLQARVYQDWKDATMQALRTDAVRELGKKYTVQIAGAAK